MSLSFDEQLGPNGKRKRPLEIENINNISYYSVMNNSYLSIRRHLLLREPSKSTGTEYLALMTRNSDSAVKENINNIFSEKLKTKNNKTRFLIEIFHLTDDKNFDQIIKNINLLEKFYDGPIKYFINSMVKYSQMKNKNDLIFALYKIYKQNVLDCIITNINNVKSLFGMINKCAFEEDQIIDYLRENQDINLGYEALSLLIGYVNQVSKLPDLTIIKVYSNKYILTETKRKFLEDLSDLRMAEILKKDENLVNTNYIVPEVLLQRLLKIQEIHVTYWFQLLEKKMNESILVLLAKKIGFHFSPNLQCVFRHEPSVEVVKIFLKRLLIWRHDKVKTLEDIIPYISNEAYYTIFYSLFKVASRNKAMKTHLNDDYFSATKNLILCIYKIKNDVDFTQKIVKLVLMEGNIQAFIAFWNSNADAKIFDGLIENYNLSDTEIEFIFSNLVQKYPSTSIMENLKFWYKKCKAQNSNFKMPPNIINWILTDFDYVRNILLEDFNVNQRIFGSFQPGLTMIEMLIRIMNDCKNEAVRPKFYSFLKELIEKSKDLSLHTEIDFITMICFGNVDETLVKKLLSTRKNTINLLYNNVERHTVSVDINAMDPFNSASKYIGNYKIMSSHWKICYEGQTGRDAGGVIKDFYYVLGKDIKKYFAILDNFCYIDKKSSMESGLWFKIGLLLGKMFAIDKLACGICLHPYLMYKLTHPDQKCRNEIDFESNPGWYEDVPQIKNMQKLSHFNKEEWEKYCKSMDLSIDIKGKAEYFCKYLIEEYEKDYQPALDQFTHGFWAYGDQTRLKFVNEISLQQAICGRLKYKIFGEENALEKSIRFGTNLGPYKMIILKVLEKFNNQDNEKFQKIIRFWFGSSYLDFSITTADIIGIQYQKGLDICFSHTCSNELVLPIPPIQHQFCEDTITEFYSKIFENTIYNQDLADSNNLQTQIS